MERKWRLLLKGLFLEWMSSRRRPLKIQRAWNRITSLDNFSISIESLGRSCDILLGTFWPNLSNVAGAYWVFYWSGYYGKSFYSSSILPNIISLNRVNYSWASIYPVITCEQIMQNYLYHHMDKTAMLQLVKRTSLQNDCCRATLWMVRLSFVC